MNGKINLCLAAVLVGQTMSSSLFGGEEFEKIDEEFAQSTVFNHYNQAAGIPAINPADRQKYYKIAKSTTELKNEAANCAKLKEAVRKNLKKIDDETEKEIKK